MAAYKKVIAVIKQATAAEFQAAAAEVRLIKQRYLTSIIIELSDQSIHSNKVVVDAERVIKLIKFISTASEPIESIQASECTQASEQVNTTAAALEPIQKEPHHGGQIRALIKQKTDAAEAPQQQQQQRDN